MVDGHCATDSEAIYVGTSGTSTCSDTTGTGSSSAPECSLQAGVTLAKTGSKSVVIVRGTLAAPSIGVATTIAVSGSLTIIGKNSAVIVAASGADGIDITSGTVYLRNLTVQGATSTGMGIKASPDTGSTVALYVNGCKIANNPGGGILLNGAAFDIENSTITGNGPGTLGVATWGGVLINALPASGPTTLNLVTAQNNNPVGISCSGSVTGTGVLATSNLSTQITPSCGFSSCASASATCGAP
jgi:hypothetical protein